MGRANEPLQPLRLQRTLDVRVALLDEYLELKEKLGPLEKRLEDVRDRLRDLVTEEGHFVDEMRAVMVRVEPRFRGWPGGFPDEVGAEPRRSTRLGRRRGGPGASDQVEDIREAARRGPTRFGRG